MRRGHLRTTLSEEAINPWDRPAGDRRSNDACEGMRTRRPCVSDHAREGRQPIEIARRAARALRVGGTPRVVSNWIGWVGPTKSAKNLRRVIYVRRNS